MFSYIKVERAIEKKRKDDSLTLVTIRDDTQHEAHNPKFENMEREREIQFISFFEDRGHQGPYSPYKLFNHNLYIGIIIFPHIDNPQSTGYN